jgi:hypothetical protein
MAEVVADLLYWAQEATVREVTTRDIPPRQVQETVPEAEEVAEVQVPMEELRNLELQVPQVRL